MAITSAHAHVTLHLALAIHVFLALPPMSSAPAVLPGTADGALADCRK